MDTRAKRGNENEPWKKQPYLNGKHQRATKQRTEQLTECAMDDCRRNWVSDLVFCSRTFSNHLLLLVCLPGQVILFGELISLGLFQLSTKFCLRFAKISNEDSVSLHHGLRLLLRSSWLLGNRVIIRLIEFDSKFLLNKNLTVKTKRWQEKMTIFKIKNLDVSFTQELIIYSKRIYYAWISVHIRYKDEFLKLQSFQCDVKIDTIR